jgi:sugar/nucleoside kinase (ribokinase family)
VLNKEEAQVLCRKKEVRKCLLKFSKVGVKIGVVTDGPNAIHAYDGATYYKLKPHRVKIRESTGAGDAFGSGFVSALIKGKSVEDALRIGLVNSQSVIRYVGAKHELLGWAKALRLSKNLKVTKC